MSDGRRIRSSVAMSLDRFIADEDGGYAWITGADGIDFGAWLGKIDTLLMGRGTYEVANATAQGRSIFDGMKVFVVSTTLDPEAHPDVTVIADDVEARVRDM